MQGIMRKVLCFAVLLALSAVARAQSFPSPIDNVKASGEQTAVLAGGCFWGVEAVFERLTGVKNVVSGYAGGSKISANYRVVSTGTTGHAESVRIVYDSRKVSYGTLLKIFFAVAHDPTQLNRQGPDDGPQYRSAIFYADNEQKAAAEAYIRQLNQAGVFSKPIVTQVVSLDDFYPAEPEHQEFIRRNPTNPYVVRHDLPKIEHLERDYPHLLKAPKERN
jgi:peptide-methionine (S)-S-oxide reductase